MKELLNEEYDRLKNTSLSEQGVYNTLNNIVQIKIEEPHLVKLNNDLSVDFKKMIIASIELAETAPNRYDSIKASKFKEMIHSFSQIDRILYLNYMIRQLQKSSFEQEIKEFQKLRTLTILNHSLRNFSFRNLIRIVIYFPLVSILTMLLTLGAFGMIYSLILLPAPFEWMGILKFKIQYTEISDNNVVNHFLNSMASLVGANDGFELSPKNTLTAIIVILGKTFTLLYVAVLIKNKLDQFINRR